MEVRDLNTGGTAPVTLAPSTPINTQSVQRQTASLKQSIYNHNGTLDTVKSNLSSLRRRVVNIEEQLRGRPPPGITAWQAWKEEASNTLDINKPTEKPSSGTKFRCAHRGCDYLNKQVRLNAYILHVHRKPNIKSSTNPDRTYLRMYQVTYLRYTNVSQW